MNTRKDCHCAIKALPVSNKPLADFDNFTLLNRNVLESVVIDIPEHCQETDPVGDLFKLPIQIVVLSANEGIARLAVYANSFLQIQQGREPSAEWCNGWRKDQQCIAKQF